jgi:opacity protein-like surface antigen
MVGGLIVYKKIIFIAFILFIFASVSFASPLMDYSTGKGTVDLTIRNTANKLYAMGESVSLDKKYNFDGAVTVGLGNNIAFQYRHFSPKSAATSFVDSDGDLSIGTLKMRTNEFNLLRKVDKSVAILAGAVTTSGVATDQETGSYETSNVHAKTFWHVGIVASTEIAKKTSLWATASVGAGLFNYEVGLGYALSSNWEVNVNYRGMDLRKLSSDNSQSKGNVKLQGLGFGITYRF